jgi:hypothetical protein
LLLRRALYTIADPAQQRGIEGLLGSNRDFQRPRAACADPDEKIADYWGRTAIFSVLVPLVPIRTRKSRFDPSLFDPSLLRPWFIGRA